MKKGLPLSEEKKQQPSRIKIKDYELHLKKEICRGLLQGCSFIEATSKGKKYIARRIPAPFEKTTYRFMTREHDILTKYKSPHLISIVEMFHHPKVAYTVIYEEYNKTPDSQITSLRNIIVTGELFSEDDVREFLHHIIKALSLLHNYGIIVRLLSPDSILLQLEGGQRTYKISDIMLAIADADPQMTRFHDSKYMAPEIVKKGNGRLPENYTNVADSYSLGQLILKLACNDDKALFGLKSPSFRHLISRCIESEHSKRIKIEEILAHPFMCEPDKLEREYTVGIKVGKGAMGEVYKVIHNATKVQYALKKINIERMQTDLKAFDDAIRQRDLLHLLHEIVVMYVLSNTRKEEKHFARIEEFFRDEKHFYYVMEFCSGPTLKKLIKAHPEGFSETEAKKILSDIAKGLSSLHSQKIIHRDVKPGNIVFSGEDYMKSDAKLVDFGLSIIRKQAMEEFSACGYTPPYFPWDAFSSYEINESVDIFAFGVIAYELFTGAHPWRKMADAKDKEQAKTDLHKKGIVHFPDKLAIKDKYKRLILCCIEPNFANRPTIEDVIKTYLS